MDSKPILIVGGGPAGLAAAHSQALAKVSSDIAAAIREAAENTSALEERSRAGAKKGQ